MLLKPSSGKYAFSHAAELPIVQSPTMLVIPDLEQSLVKRVLKPSDVQISTEGSACLTLSVAA